MNPSRCALPQRSVRRPYRPSSAVGTRHVGRRKVARDVGCPFVLLHKTRYCDSDEVLFRSGLDQWTDRTAVINVDTASTARRMTPPIAGEREAGMPDPHCVVVHVLFAGTLSPSCCPAGGRGGLHNHGGTPEQSART